MTDARETYKILDLALRIGEILLSSGAGAADVTATMLGITHHYGLRNADIDVTFTLLRMSYQVDPEEMPVLLTRNVNQRDIDYDDLTRTQELVNDILDDRVDVAEARARVARVNSTGHWLPKLGRRGRVRRGRRRRRADPRRRGRGHRRRRAGRRADHDADAHDEPPALADVLPADRGRHARHGARAPHRRASARSSTCASTPRR